MTEDYSESFQRARKSSFGSAGGVLVAHRYSALSRSANVRVPSTCQFGSLSFFKSAANRGSLCKFFSRG
jgi:hypothetical protein